MKVLIVGAGIAGPTLAYWLVRSGHEPTLVERSPSPRRGGYVIDFWGAGFDVAERMGIVPDLLEKGYRVQELREVTGTGRVRSRFDPRPVLDSLGGRYVSIPRSDLAAAILAALGGKVETLFGDTVQQLHDDGSWVRVMFASGMEREFDLVVGADGLHSRVRSLTFGPEAQFERRMGISVAAFEVAGYRPREELMAVTHTVVGAQALRFTVRDDATMFFFSFRHSGEAPDGDVDAQQAFLRRRLGRMGWEVPRILDQMPAADAFYFDSASQILMPSWARGRIALIGDAAAGPSLLSGQGSALAMIEAYVLAAELQRAAGRHAQAFAAYQARLGPLVRRKQDAARRLGVAFAPRNRAELALRNSAVGFMGIPVIAKAVMGRSLRDPLQLPVLPAG